MVQRLRIGREKEIVLVKKSNKWSKGEADKETRKKKTVKRIVKYVKTRKMCVTQQRLNSYFLVENLFTFSTIRTAKQARTKCDKNKNE